VSEGDKNAKCKMQNAKCKMQNAKCKMQNAKCKMQNAKCKMQNAIRNTERRRKFRAARRRLVARSRASSERNEDKIPNEENTAKRAKKRQIPISTKANEGNKERQNPERRKSPAEARINDLLTAAYAGLAKATRLHKTLHLIMTPIGSLPLMGRAREG
jgi:hypothetical protein